MILRSFVVLGILFTSLSGLAQDQPTTEKTTETTETTPARKKGFRPDIPGNIIIEFGFNFKNGFTPPDFQKSFWGSRTFNVYYQYPIRILKSNISFVPGIGLSLERWKFTNDYTMSPSVTPSGTYELISASTLYPRATINRSQLINNYLEMPIEVRYDTNPEDMARSLSLSFGARVGVLYDSFTKIDYTENSEDKSMKDKQRHGVNPIRYGLYGRAGIGGFGLFGYVNMSPMFEKNKGPLGTQMNSVTIGVSVSGF